MSTDGPGGIPPKPTFKRSFSEMAPEKAEKEIGATGDGRKASKAEAQPTGSLKKKRKFSIQPLSITNLEPLSGASPGLSVSPQRRQSSPGILSSPLKTPVKDEIKLMWHRLESQKPSLSVRMCSDEASRVFRFHADEIVADTVVMTGKGELTPHNRITLDGISVGVAARGPKTSEQAEVIYDTALAENCGAIVNLTTALEGMVDDYLPEPGAISTFGGVTVERLSNGLEGGADSRSLFSMKPIHTRVRVRSSGSLHELVFHWERGMVNHVSAPPELLVNLSRSLPKGPVLVHCQKGVGRTAMVMLVHAMNTRKEQGLGKDQAIQTLINMIADGRRCRGEFLENERQLQSVLKAVAILYGITDEELIAAVSSCSAG